MQDDKANNSVEKDKATNLQISNPPSQDVNIELRYPQKDRGLKAWLFLIGAWFPFAYGVFREYFFSHQPFQGATIVSTGGLLANGVLQICVPFIIYILNNFPHQRKNAMWLGCVICSVSPISAAFTNSPSVLVVLLGPLYGIGAGLLFAPSMHFMDDWFLERKSFAYGIICGAGAGSGAALSPVYAISLEKYGYKPTLVAMGLITLVVTAGGLVLMNPRTPAEKAPKPTRRDFDFLRKPLFLVFLAATVVQSSSNYGPTVYLPSIGADFGLSNTQGALLVSLQNLAQAIGQPLQGALAVSTPSDTSASFYAPLVLSTLGGSASCLLIWPFARQLWSLVIFSLVFGALVPGFAVLRPRFAAAVIGKDRKVATQGDVDISEATVEEEEAETETETETEAARQRNKSLLIFGILTAARGIAIVAASFVSVALVHEESADLSGYGLGTKWRNLIIYTGVTMAVASLGAIGKFIPFDAKIGQ
ncbi:major facilitator superfamily domain-containing protein [Poronia punctata]|nr:major facilitator superfamily domain-containing protein [Poronia punctata]